jgi:hypothetical protein
LGSRLQDREIQRERETTKVALYARVSNGYYFHIPPNPRVKFIRNDAHSGYTLWRFVK